MRKSITNMSPVEFRKFAKRMSKYIDLKGCESEECIRNRIRCTKSRYLRGLLKSSFPYKMIIQSCINPHPVYKEILDIHEDDYNRLVKEKRESEKDVKMILEDIKTRKKIYY